MPRRILLRSFVVPCVARLAGVASENCRAGGAMILEAPKGDLRIDA